MKFVCSRERLLAGVQIVGSVVSTRGMKPVYESLLIRSRDGDLELMGTDLEVAIRYLLESGGQSHRLGGTKLFPPGGLRCRVEESGPAVGRKDLPGRFLRIPPASGPDHHGEKRDPFLQFKHVVAEQFEHVEP